MVRSNVSPRRVFVDTSALIALASSSDSLHLRARSVERSLRSAHAELFCTNYIVAEAHGLAVGRVGRNRALVLLRALDSASFTVVEATEEDEAAARQVIEKYSDKAFSLVDAISFVVMEEIGVTTAFSFDDHFRQYGFATL
jgi:uncharacterized protein